MDKRDFLKGSGALIAGAMLPRMVTAEMLGEEMQAQSDTRTNWAGNYTFNRQRLDAPKTVAEVQEIVTRRKPLKALGARHSFNGVADSTGDQISLVNLNEMVLDAKARTVTVGAGVKYGQLAPYIDGLGYAVHNLASLPHVTVIGACATATHGSGSGNGNLSTAVAGLELVNGSGEVVRLSRKDVHFAGAVVGLGGLGVVTKVTLDVVPAFQVRQMIYENLSFDRLEKHLDEIFASGYSVSLFTDWQNGRATQVWMKHKVMPGEKFEFPKEFFGATMQTRKMHPIGSHSAENCTEQMGVPGPWYERLPHFKMNFTPSSGAEIQTEYFVPRAKGYEAIRAVETLRDQITPHLFITELRTIAADDFWLSPCHQRDAMALHFTWKPEGPEVHKVLPLIEAKLAPFDVRPHWAKVYTMDPVKIRAQYPKMPEFVGLLKEHDPQGKFRNAYLDRVIYGV